MPRTTKPSREPRKRSGRRSKTPTNKPKSTGPVGLQPYDFETWRAGQPYYNWGGHLIDPPERCEWRKTADDGGVWTDFALCMTRCEDHCERYKRVCKMNPVMRARDLRRRGVKYPLHRDDPNHPNYEYYRREKKRKENAKK